MEKTYEYDVKVEAYIVFDESDIPEGMTPEEYAEELYCDGETEINAHSIKEIK